jgi:hypothetical protein
MAESPEKVSRVIGLSLRVCLMETKCPVPTLMQTGHGSYRHLMDDEKDHRIQAEDEERGIEQGTSYSA